MLRELKLSEWTNVLRKNDVFIYKNSREYMENDFEFFLEIKLKCVDFSIYRERYCSFVNDNCKMNINNIVSLKQCTKNNNIIYITTRSGHVYEFIKIYE